MAVKLRLARVGKRGKALYRLVAIEQQKKRGGKYIEVIGTYNPHENQNKLAVKKDRLDFWLSVGAKPTETVAHLLRK